MIGITSLAPFLDAHALGPIDSKTLLAHRLWNRLTGGPPTPGELASVVAILNNNSLSSSRQVEEAAKLAVAHKGFINNVMVNYAAKIVSNTNNAVIEPLNDSSALIVGIAKDGIDAREMLRASYTYGFSPEIERLSNFFGYSPGDMVPVQDPIYKWIKNDAYYTAYNNKIDLSTHLVQRAQHAIFKNSPQYIPPDTFEPLPVAQTAGVLSTVRWGMHNLTAGTNRRAVRGIIENFFCSTLGAVRDSALASNDRAIDRIFKDVPKNHPDFLTTCVTCHGGVDGMAAAFAYNNTEDPHWTVNSFINRRDPLGAPYIQDKYSRTNAYTGGYTPVNASWENHFTSTRSMEIFGWRGSVHSGSNLHDLGVYISNASGFSKCLVRRAYREVCRREPASGDDELMLRSLTNRFETELGYKFKALFPAVAGTPGCLRD